MSPFGFDSDHFWRGAALDRVYSSGVNLAFLGEGIRALKSSSQGKGYDCVAPFASTIRSIGVLLSV